MTGLLLAIQFLTAIPIKISNFSENKAALSVIYFPVVGFLLGAILCLVDRLLYFLNFPQFATNIILVVALAILTGNMHLDGLSDTFDALSSNKNRQEMLAIMRDSHAGVMGVTSVACVILLKVALISSLPAYFKNQGLLMMCVLSRWSLVLAMLLYPYARKEGKALLFIQGINRKIFILSTIFALLFITLIAKLSSLWVFFSVGAFTYIFGNIVNRKIGGITGDTLGANNELAEIIILFAAVILTRGIS